MKRKHAKFALVMLALLVAAALLGTYLYRVGGVVESIDATGRHRQEDIRACLDQVRQQYAAGFDNARLLRLRYDDDFGQKWEAQEAEYFGGQEAIIILADFVTGFHTGPLNPHDIYTDWKWIFVKNDAGIWDLAGSGYA